jgi:hypothetical protein
MSADSDPRPCGGDVHRHWTEGDTRIGDDCYNCGYHNEPKSWANYQKRPDSGFGKCLGSDGYAFFLPVALEVAGERGDAYHAGYQAATMEAL